jgi:hypothetical protein
MRRVVDRPAPEIDSPAALAAARRALERRRLPDRKTAGAMSIRLLANRPGNVAPLAKGARDPPDSPEVAPRTVEAGTFSLGSPSHACLRQPLSV